MLTNDTLHDGSNSHIAVHNHLVTTVCECAAGIISLAATLFSTYIILT